MRPVRTWFCIVRRFFCVLLICAGAATNAAIAQTVDPQTVDLPTLSSSAKISLVTYSPGDELYMAFGHSAIRIDDPELGFDRLYNFGTFDMTVDHFYLRFARGDLQYQLSVDSGAADINEHGAIGQGVTQVELALSPEQEQALFASLETNLLPQNRYYRYDFLLDNCSTRIRDAFEKVIGEAVGDKTVHGLTFRQMLDPYLERIPWIHFGIYLLLGAGVDRLVEPREACFLPANLEAAVRQTELKDKAFGQDPARLYPERPLPRMSRLLDPEIVFSTVLVAWIGLWLLRERRSSRILSALVFVLFGLVGLFLVVLATNTEHWEAYQNWNLAWLVPTHLIAGIGLIFTPANQLFLLRLYLSLAVGEAVIFMFSSPWLPQRFHTAIYPLVILVVWRSAIELSRRTAA